MGRVTRTLVIGLLFALVPGRSQAQDSLQHVKDLYASAAYEDALAVVEKLGSREPTVEIEQYRVSCLVALGRAGDAQKAIEALVESHPMYLPDASETSPRVRELFVATRREMLPAIARKMYVEAKAAFDRKDAAVATAKFTELLRLADEAGPGGHPTLGELRLLAEGFIDLGKAMSEVASPPARAAAETPPEPAPAPARPPDITKPVALAQEFPRWVPFDAVSRQTEFVGSVRVRILPTGAVESAEILKPVHPAYDTALLAAARSWRYQPATHNGVAVSAEHIVEVRLRPRE
jgi:TonB family protein